MTTIRSGQMGTKLLCAALLSSSALVAAPAAAQTWKGTTSTDWNDPTNWSPSTLPTSPTSNVLIDTVTPNTTDFHGNTDVIKSLIIGDTNKASLRIDGNGHLIVTDQFVVGNQSGSAGSLTINGSDSEFDLVSPNSPDKSIIGNAGTGSVSVLAGAHYIGSDVTIGALSTGIGTINIAGASGFSASTLTVGDAGTGQITVAGGSHLTTGYAAYIGGQTSGFGSVVLAGVGTSWIGQNVIVANNGLGALTVQGGAALTLTGNLDLGENGVNDGSHGAAVTADGAGSAISTAQLNVGITADSSLKITNQASVNAQDIAVIGFNAGTTGAVAVDGANSAFFTDLLEVGRNGAGNFELSNGGAANIGGTAVLGDFQGAQGNLTVADKISSVKFNGEVDVGESGVGSLAAKGLVQAQGQVVLGFYNTGNGSISLDGGILEGGDTVTIGNIGTGTVTMDHTSQLSAPDLVLANSAGSSGSLSMDNNSSAIVGGALTIGKGGNGFVQLADGAQLRVDGNGGAGSGTISLGTDVGSFGALLIGGINGNQLAPGTVDAANVVFGGGSGVLAFNHTQGMGYLFTSAISGGTSNSTIAVGGGDTVLTADSSGYKGETLVQGQYAQDAILEVDGKLGGNVEVGGNGLTSKSILMGKGAITGPVIVENNGTLLSEFGHTLTMGSLLLGSGAIIDADLEDATKPALFDIGGDLTLDGTVNVINTNLGAGVYRLFDYGGTLTDNGLDIGTVPSGTASSDLSVQTSVAGQVNIVYGPNGGGGNPPGGGGNPPGGGGNPPGGGGGNPPPAGSYSFWDGDAAGNASNGVIDGGDGKWTATSSNFTDANGTAIGTYDSSLVVFEGKSGTVTVDNSAGQIKFDKLQFATGGYQLQGDDLTLDKNVTIWVGDGTAQSAGYDATIANRLTGNGGLTKTDLGTLVLTGNNSYTGGTTIGGGTLLIGNGGTSGSIVGNVDNAGTLGFDRSDDVTFDGIVSGTGALEQYGSGTVTLTGANTYTGETGIADGTIALSGGGSVASSSHVYLEFGTFDISGASGGGASIRALQGIGTVELGANTLTLTNADGSTFYGAITGSGALHLANGTAVLASENTYTGGTIIDAGGILAVGDGTTYGSITGDILDNGGLGFNRSDAVTFAGDISGNGLVAVLGTGALTLTGTNSYTGGTVVTAGTLIGDTRSLQGQFQNASHLVFAQSFDGTFNGGIFGAGDVTKSGAGTLTVAASQNYTGATMVDGGGLILLGGAANSDVIVNAGLLGGYGPLKSLNVIGGTLSPGQSPGMMTVTGNATLGANSTYAVDLAAGGVSDLLAVGGKVTLNGGALALKSTGQFGVSYQIISAQGGVTGAFGSVTGGVSKPFMATQVSYQPDAVFVTDVLNSPAVVAAGRTPNQVAAARGVVDLPVTSPVVAAIANLDATSAPGAFDQLSGEIHASIRGAITEDARAAGDRLLETIARRRGLWGEATVGGRSIDGDGNAAGLRGSVRSVLVGADGGSDTLRAGLTVGYGWDDVDIAGRDSSARMEAWRIGGYLVAEPGRGFEFKAAGLYSHWRGDVSRGVTFAGYSDRLSSRDSAGMVQGMAELGWKANAGKAVIEPFGSLDWVGLSGSTIKEKGGAAALTGRAQRQDSWFGKLGLRASTEIAPGSVKIEPRASLAWERAFGDRLPAADLGFAGSATGSLYAVTGPIAPRGRVNGELGFDVVGKTIDIGLSVGGSYADRTSQTSVKLHMRWEF